MSRTAPAFYFDLASPEAYLAAERVLQVMPVATPWVPVLERELPGGGQAVDAGTDDRVPPYQIIRIPVDGRPVRPTRDPAGA